MKISGIGSLFASITSPVDPPRESGPVTPVKGASRIGEGDDAAVVSPKLQEQSKQSAAANSQHQEKLDRITKQVQNGSYKMDSPKMAEAIMRDLM